MGKYIPCKWDTKESWSSNLHIRQNRPQNKDYKRQGRTLHNDQGINPKGRHNKCKYLCTQRRFDPWIGKIPWRRKWQPTPVLLPGKSHGQRSLVGYCPWGRKELDTTEQLHAPNTGAPQYIRNTNRHKRRNGQ